MERPPYNARVCRRVIHRIKQDAVRQYDAQFAILFSPFIEAMTASEMEKPEFTTEQGMEKLGNIRLEAIQLLHAQVAAPDTENTGNSIKDAALEFRNPLDWLMQRIAFHTSSLRREVTDMGGIGL